ncbi:MAG: nucleotide sugar dehydrogenase [Bacteroidetes bacterium]|nr:nucleotide sugar dehydrogenase [Bacteroidota bacterium]
MVIVMDMDLVTDMAMDMVAMVDTAAMVDTDQAMEDMDLMVIAEVMDMAMVTDLDMAIIIDDLKNATFFVVAVPTPIDEHRNPDLKPLLGATNTVSKVLKKGDIVVFESTVYPGCTEEDCVPILEKNSGLLLNEDFSVGYSPERINPGDKEHTLTKIKKVVSASNADSLTIVSKVYGAIITAGLHEATSIKVAEAAKIIENTQRDVNISLMNELSLIFNKMNINTYDVLEAANTKWNFLKFYPGLVGGHCIGVDPYYLTYKAAEIGYHSKVIMAGRSTNDAMGGHIARQIITELIQKEKIIKKSKVLIMGATFKENVSDIRNSKVVDIVNELKSFFVNVEVSDPKADSTELAHEYGFELVSELATDYDAVIVAVSHEEYMGLDETYFKSILKPDGLIYDVKGTYRRIITQFKYLSL